MHEVVRLVMLPPHLQSTWDSLRYRLTNRVSAFIMCLCLFSSVRAHRTYIHIRGTRAFPCAWYIRSSCSLRPWQKLEKPRMFLPSSTTTSHVSSTIITLSLRFDCKSEFYCSMDGLLGSELPADTPMWDKLWIAWKSVFVGVGVGAPLMMRCGFDPAQPIFISCGRNHM